MGPKFVRKSVSLDAETNLMLKKASKEMHISESSLLRLLIVKNEKEGG